MKIVDQLFAYLKAIARTIHPVRALFEVCGTMIISIPFLVAFFFNRSAPIYVYLLYPALFLVSHLVWFRLPFVDRRVRWILIWFSLTIIVALGSGFLYWNYREAVAAGASFTPTGVFLIPHWVSPTLDVPFPTVCVYFLVPSGIGAALYCLILALFLKVFRKYRQEERQKRVDAAQSRDGQGGRSQGGRKPAKSDKDDAERE
jgi:hypothetical protein